MARKTTVRLDNYAIAQLALSPSGPVILDMKRRANRVKNKARRLCPVDQGTLRASIADEILVERNAIIARVGSNLDYALYVHEGTGEAVGKGPIVPKSKKALRWPIKNNSGSGRRRYQGGATAGYVFSKRSRGIKPTPFLRDALDAGL